MKAYKIAFIGNYVPRHCGIATFTRDLVEAMVKNSIKKDLRAEAYVVAMNDLNESYDYPAVVTYTIRQDHQRDYLKAVEYINYSGADICLLQHEFGIFGGDDGVYILSLVHRLKIPLAVTFHTVLEKPSYNQKIIIQKIANKAQKVVVMSNLAIDFLTDIYHVPKEKIHLIEHGVPDFTYMQRKEYKKLLKLENRKSLLTFGLLSKDKGIETVIHALPRVWELTEGQPWLVNALAYETCFKMKEGQDRSKEITAEMIAQAKENLILRRETHLDQLTDKLVC